MLIIPKILEYSQDPPGDIVYGVGLCLALFLTECLKSLSLCSSWVVNQRTGIRLRSAVFLFAFEKLIQFKSLTHITTGEVSDPDAHGRAPCSSGESRPPARTGSLRGQSCPQAAVLPLLYAPARSRPDAQPHFHKHFRGSTKQEGPLGDARKLLTAFLESRVHRFYFKINVINT